MPSVAASVGNVCRGVPSASAIVRVSNGSYAIPAISLGGHKVSPCRPALLISLVAPEVSDALVPFLAALGYVSLPRILIQGARLIGLGI